MRVFGFVMVDNSNANYCFCLDILAAEDAGEQRRLPAATGPQQREDGALPHLMTVMMIMMMTVMIKMMNMIMMMILTRMQSSLRMVTLPYPTTTWSQG